MTYFSKEAFLTYLILTEVGFDEYMVSQSDYRERLMLLRGFCDPGDKEIISMITFRLSDPWVSNNGSNEFNYPRDEDNRYNSSTEFENKDNELVSATMNKNQDNYDPIIYFIHPIKGKFTKWEFHLTDSDPFPSVPHGHSIVNHKIKLDPYLGHIYKNDVATDRELRRYIIDLWNDVKFREHAKQTIIYYDDHFPLHKWRVQNKYKLPRRRR